MRPIFTALDQARRRGVGVVLMRLRHVLADGDVPGALRGAAVAGDTLVIVEDFDDPRGQANLDLPADQAMRHRVEGLVDLDIVVGMHLRRFPFGIFEGGCRKRRKCSAFDLLEDLTPGLVDAAHRPIIEIVEKLADPDVEVGKAEEVLVAQPCQDPALDDENAAFHLDGSAGPLCRNARRRPQTSR